MQELPIMMNTASRLRLGDTIASRTLDAISGHLVSLPDSGRLIHLQFRRFAGCPVCNLHLRSFVQRHQEIEQAGVREVVVFHSKKPDLLIHAGEFPFDVIADPEKRLYREFGVESSPRSLMNPRTWLPIVRGILRSVLAIARGRGAIPSINPEGGRFGLPADFLIAPDGTIRACKYGAHAYDQWSVDELLAHAKSERLEMADAR
jgi:peroxiredoxin